MAKRNYGHGYGIKTPPKMSKRELERHFEEHLAKIAGGSSLKPVTYLGKNLLKDIKGTHMDSPENRKLVREHVKKGIPASDRMLLADLETGRLDEEHIRGILEKLHGKGYTTPELENAAIRGKSASVKKQIEYIERLRDGRAPVPNRMISEAALKALKYPEGEGSKRLMREHDKGFLLNYAFNLAREVEADERIPEAEKTTHLARLRDLMKSLEEPK